MEKKEKSDDFLFNLFKRLDQVQSSNRKPSRKIAIFSTPRSGSSYFCDLLTQTKIFGEPLDWFHNRFYLAYGKKFGQKKINLNEYTNYIITKTSSESGIFSTKIQIPDYFFLLNEKKFDLLSLDFDDIILINRRDKIAQAYSLTKALITDQWFSFRFSFIKPSSEVNLDSIKNSDVLRQLHNIVLWEELFESRVWNKPALKYIYEDFIKQKDFLNIVLKDLKISTSFETDIKSHLLKQTTQHDLIRIEQLKKSINLN